MIPQLMYKRRSWFRRTVSRSYVVQIIRNL